MATQSTRPVLRLLSAQVALVSLFRRFLHFFTLPARNSATLQQFNTVDDQQRR